MKKMNSWDAPYDLVDRALRAYKRATGERENLGVRHCEIEGRELCVVLKHGAAAAVYLVGKDRNLQRLRRLAMPPSKPHNSSPSITRWLAEEIW